ncbi:TPA: hypothetical protein JLG68_001371 [Escherichia coli]|nr:hypothetical protein [Escherichia coli]
MANTTTTPTAKTFDEVLAERIASLEANAEQLSNKELALLVTLKSYKKVTP